MKLLLLTKAELKYLSFVVASDLETIFQAGDDDLKVATKLSRKLKSTYAIL